MKRVPKGQPNGGQFAPGAAAPPPVVHVPSISKGGQPDTRQEMLDLALIHGAFRGDSHNVGMVQLPPLPADGEPPVVIVLRGIPGSGKSTWARAVQHAYPPGTVTRINNDELSHTLFGSSNANFTPGIAGTLRSLRSSALAALLKNPSVRMVIIDNTNLSERTVREMEDIAQSHGVDMQVDDRFLSVPLDVCLQRNAVREDPVPENVIRKMSKQASSLTPWESQSPAITPYHNNPDLPHSILVDVDGTLATMHPDRSPYDWGKVGIDMPNTAVIHAVRAMKAQGVEVIVMSGRDGSCRDETQKWLDTHVAENLNLHMRAEGDSRPDHIVKYELFQKHVADQYHVRCVFDDRDQVVNLWRRKLHLPTFQVADGDF